MSLDITPMVPTGRQLIGGYGDGGFTIAGVRHDGAVVVRPDRTLAWDAPAVDALDLAALALLVETVQPGDIVLVGCGPTFAVPPKGLRAALKETHGVVLEWMDTGAACRTFNVLLAEGRAAAAALLPVD